MWRRIFFVANPRQSRGLSGVHSGRGFTLVEMLVAMAITLVMMAAVVTLFANVSGSVRNRRATIEMSGQLRHVRNMLQQDLQGATCPGLTWQRPESNHGYIELIEGLYREGDASQLIDGVDDTAKLNREIDRTTSILPTSNIPLADSGWATDGSGLGDYDDILMLTVRNEHEPFVGRVPSEVRISGSTRATRFDEWKYETAQSTLAEVVWFAVENPADVDNVDNFYGEPGMRTIYRRALLVAPWINPYRLVDNNGNEVPFNLTGESDKFVARPGLVRILLDDINHEDLNLALAALVAFQDRYDLSVRLEWDPNLGADGRYKLVANTLGDLTKRENRYEHYSYRPMRTVRDYPYAAMSVGSGYDGSPRVVCWTDLESPATSPPYEEGTALIADAGGLTGVAVAYSPKVLTVPDIVRPKYRWRPFAYVDDDSDTLATVRAVLNDNEEVTRLVHGLVPLSNERRGEDVMMSDVLAFDLRVYDPGAPLFRHVATETILEPSDHGWRGTPPKPPDPAVPGAYLHNDNMKLDGTGFIGTGSTTFPYVGQGAYVDMGYGYNSGWPEPMFERPRYTNAFSSSLEAWFFVPRALSDVFGNQLAPGYAVYDTWSFHYENNGVNEDADEVEAGVWQLDDGNGMGIPSIDESTNGLEDFGHYADGNVTRLGVDDVGERETVPPYDKPLRGVQVIMRAYERDSRAIRQLRVNQHFMPE